MAYPEISTTDCHMKEAMSSAMALIFQSWALALNVSVHLGWSNGDCEENRSLTHLEYSKR